MLWSDQQPALSRFSFKKCLSPFSLYFEGKNRKLSLWQAIFYR